MKRIFTLVVALMPVVSFAQLGPGDIAFVGFNADGNDHIAFVALKVINPGEEIFFENNEWNGSAFTDTNQGAFRWTAVNFVARGQIVNIESVGAFTITASTGTVTDAAALATRGIDRNLTDADEVLYAYQGSAASPTFLTAIATGGFNATNGQLPASLTLGTNAINIGAIDDDADIAEYNGPRNNRTTYDAYRPLINTAANWITQDATGDQSNDGIAPNAPFNKPGFTLLQVNLFVSTDEGREADATVITVSAEATAPVVGNQTVTLAIAATNLSPSDYTLSNTTITILNGQTVGSVTFTVINDAISESNEFGSFQISNPSAGIILGSVTSRPFSIIDNDAPVVNLSVSANTATEAPATVVTITATASAPIGTGGAGVNLLVEGDVSAEDYTLSNSQIVILSGATTGSVTFTVVNDVLVEPLETATIRIGNIGGPAMVGTTTSQNIVITSDDVLAPVATAATNILGNSFTANWQAVPGATRYQVDVSSNNFAESITLQATGTSVVVNEVEVGIVYSYRVRAEVAGNVSANSNVITLLITGVEEQGQPLVFDAFPNPADQRIEFSRASDFEMRTLLGTKVKSGHGVLGVDVADLAEGIYLVRDQKGATQKIVIKH